MTGPRERRFQEFIEFLTVFICELNVLAQEGAVVLVEGKRDRDALTELGYNGPILTKAALHSEKGVARLRRVKLAIIPHRPGRGGQEAGCQICRVLRATGHRDVPDAEEEALEGVARYFPPRGEPCAFRTHCA